MKNNVIKAAGIQIFCNTSKQGMLEKAEKYIEQAIQNYPDIDLFVLPEQFYQMDCYEYENETKRTTLWSFWMYPARNASALPYRFLQKRERRSASITM